MHPVISVAQLEPLHFDENLYDRPKLKYDRAKT